MLLCTKFIIIYIICKYIQQIRQLLHHLKYQIDSITIQILVHYVTSQSSITIDLCNIKAGQLGNSHRMIYVAIITHRVEQCLYTI